MKTRVKKSKIKVRLYAILSEAVERGVGWGIHYAYKYQDHEMPDQERERLKEQIEQNVMSELCDVIDFD